MSRTKTDALFTPGAIGDPTSVVMLEGGRQIDWANVADSFKDPVTGKKVLPAFYPVGDLLSGGNAVSPRVVTTNPAIGLLASTAVEGDPSAAKSGYGIIKGGVFVTTAMDFDTATVLAAAVKTELNASGTGYVFQTRTDSRAV